MSATTDGFDRDDPPVLGANPFVGLTRRQVGAALARLAQRVAVEPAVAAAAAVDATGQIIRVGVGRSDIVPSAGDRRFADKAWQNNPAFRRLMQAYLVEQQAAHRLIDDVELDDKSRARAHFALSLVTEALAPPNNLLTNPNALAKAAQTRGQSLLAGARHFAHDLRHNGGMPSQVDTRPFTVGGNLATTPGQVVYRSEVFELIQYRETAAKVHHRPLVAIPPQINKYYITDLAPGRSLVEATVAAGIPYFTLSWRNPTPEQRDWNLDAYVAAAREAIQVAADISRSDAVNTVGLCAGGVTLAALLGHLAASGQSALVHSATFLVAGLDTATETTVTRLMSRRAVEAARTPLATSRGARRARTWPGCSPGCGPTTWCGTTGSTTTCWGRTRPPLTSCTGTTTPPGCRPACTPTFSTCTSPTAWSPAPWKCSVRPSSSPRSTATAFVVAGAHRPHHPLGGRLPDHSAARRRQPVRAEQRGPHPGHPEPARQPQGLLPHLGHAASHRGRVARIGRPGARVVVDVVA